MSGEQAHCFRPELMSVQSRLIKTEAPLRDCCNVALPLRAASASQNRPLLIWKSQYGQFLNSRLITLPQFSHSTHFMINLLRHIGTRGQSNTCFWRSKRLSHGFTIVHVLCQRSKWDSANRCEYLQTASRSNRVTDLSARRSRHKSCVCRQTALIPDSLFRLYADHS
jgi:hypothetical protein